VDSLCVQAWVAHTVPAEAVIIDLLVPFIHKRPMSNSHRQLKIPGGDYRTSGNIFFAGKSDDPAQDHKP
jgi:hypothetical protein